MSAPEHLETVVIGAGQAGLSVGHHLAKRGRSFVILDAHERVGDNWRRHWDSLRLFSPARLDGLPGIAFPAPGWSFPTKDETADYLERYAERFELPVRGGTRVERIARDGEGYLVECDDGQIAADNVVVATGTFGRPFTPAFAGELDPRIVQLHSSEYQRPSLLQDGPVLVVGASHSGADVAMDVAPTHRTILAGRDTGQAPVDIESRRGRAVWLLLAFLARRVLTLKTPMGRKMRSEIRSHGGPLLRHRRADLEAAGVERTTARVAGVRDGRPLLDDGTVLDVANVVWCTGFRQDFGWIDLPVCDEHGWPREVRGIVPEAPGLYFSGLAFQYAFSSMLLLGAGRDAEHVAEHIASRAAVPAPSPLPV
ncbi:MAG TPA: NAD(P)-binding domain-containing protein [Solirubrobacteraceae bacterium]|nr:NAD(P)-binding domain-containing protein [Solirubrobacteraceae bacterium]